MLLIISAADHHAQVFGGVACATGDTRHRRRPANARWKAQFRGLGGPRDVRRQASWGSDPLTGFVDGQRRSSWQRYATFMPWLERD